MRTNIGFKSIAIFTLLLCMTTSAMAQRGKRHFSPEEFMAKQREYITEKAELTQEEADAFFPLFFELQKMKFDLQRNARKDMYKKCGEQMTEEQCETFVNKMADLKIEIAKLEKEYTDKYLKVISACKIMKIQHAEMTFQRDLMKKMTHHRDKKRNENKE